MKYTLFVTQRCNLACTYCYVPKHPRSMSHQTARDAIAFIFRTASSLERFEIGLFGGEPLLEFPLVRDIVGLVESHPGFAPARVGLTLVTNGTIFSDEIGAFLLEHGIRFCLSCDGPPPIQDASRRSPAGEPSSPQVERTIREARAALPAVLVNAVYGPETLDFLPETARYLSALGLRTLYFNPDFSARWTPADVARLPSAYDRLAAFYCDAYRRGDPHFISILDNKIAVLLRGGYQPGERCGMGHRELAFTPDRRIYPCERLVSDSRAGTHEIGTLDTGLDLTRLACRRMTPGETNSQCLACGLRDYCMTWCGCSNYFMTGWYNRVGPFLCASEKAAIEVGARVLNALEGELGPTFLHHLTGETHYNSVYLRT